MHELCRQRIAEKQLITTTNKCIYSYKYICICIWMKNWWNIDEENKFKLRNKTRSENYSHTHIIIWFADDQFHSIHGQNKKLLILWLLLQFVSLCPCPFPQSLCWFNFMNLSALSLENYSVIFRFIVKADKHLFLNLDK